MGWLMGAGIGWFVGGPLGAIVGGAMGHVMSQGARKQPRRIGGHQNEQIFISHLVTILTKISMADGSISTAERKAIHSFFSQGLHYKGTELKFIDALMAETERVNPDLYEVCKNFDQFAGKEQRLLLLDLIYQVAVTDHVVTKGEEQAINQVVSTLGIGIDEHDHIKSRYAMAKKHDHYSMLGLTASASDSEIKKTYRQLASEYHPDKVSHLGPELIAFANTKFKEINEAYTAIRKTRKF